MESPIKVMRKEKKKMNRTKYFGITEEAMEREKRIAKRIPRSEWHGYILKEFPEIFSDDSEVK